jgi:D-alanyl-D-alanine carboxypeptidase (penicillin-binding protein 5/6)
MIAEQDLRNPLFRKIVDTKETALPHNPVVRNLNGLLFMDPDVIGVKTGWTTAAGFNVIFAATRTINGHQVTLLGVILHAEDGFPPEDEDAEKILGWGFHQVRLESSPPRLVK